MITRLVDPHSGLTVVAIGGITTYGTLAAGNFVTTPEMFRQAIQAAPADWSRKNMQVVLETKVADNTPGPPRVLITHFLVTILSLNFPVQERNMTPTGVPRPGA